MLLHRVAAELDGDALAVATLGQRGAAADALGDLAGNEHALLTRLDTHWGERMTDYAPSTIDELCHTLGLRTPFGVSHAAELDLREKIAVPPLNDEQLTALGVLAQPEAIAVVSRRTTSRTSSRRAGRGWPST